MPKALSPPTTLTAIERKLDLQDTPKNSSSRLKDAIAAAKHRFVDRNPRSGELFEEAADYLPGGNTRTLLYSAPFPICMKKGENFQVTDEDGHVYTDFVGELTAGLYGHSHPLIQRSLINTINDVGLNLGGTIAAEAGHAKLICQRFRLDKVRFTNSGTEANLHALAGARKFTGKRKVVVFTGGYHGGVLGFWDGVQENNVDKEDWVLGKYNDVAGAKHLIEGRNDLAAVLVEGMQGAGPCIVGTKDFLMQIEESSKKVGACFILDEVMTSRLSPSGLRGLLGLTPDLTTFGKYLGGGLAFGAFGGRQEIMAVYDPRSPTSLAHSGTFNNNTLAMNAGFLGLSEIWRPEVAVEFNKIGDSFRESVQQVAGGTKMSVTGRGSILGIHFSEEGVTEISCKDDINECSDLKELFYMEMMEDGFWLTKRGSVALIIGTPQSELDRFVVCVEKFLVRHQSVVYLAQ